MPRTNPLFSVVHDKIITAIAFIYNNTKSEVVRCYVADGHFKGIKPINKLSTTERDNLINKYNSLTPEQRKYPQRG